MKVYFTDDLERAMGQLRESTVNLQSTRIQVIWTINWQQKLKKVSARNLSFDLELEVDHLESGIIVRNKMWAEHGIFEVPYEHGLIITSHFYCLLKDSDWVTVYSPGEPIRFKITFIWFLREIQNAMTSNLCSLKTRKHWTAVLSYCDAL